MIGRFEFLKISLHHYEEKSIMVWNNFLLIQFHY